MKYAIHYGDQNVTFTCKRYGKAMADFQTSIPTNCYDNIRIAYGSNVVKELLNFSKWSILATKDSQKLGFLKTK
jgi:hypothetical protein